MARPEVECIGRGRHGRRTSLAARCRLPRQPPRQGGQFVLHAKALHGNPYDGHTLGPVITDLESSQVLLSAAPRRQGLSRPQLARPVPGLD